MTTFDTTDERTGDDTLPPLSLAARWGGTGHLADLGPDLPAMHYVEFGGPGGTAGGDERIPRWSSCTASAGRTSTGCCWGRCCDGTVACMRSTWPASG